MAVCPEETANRVLQRSLSIPITMRAVINRGKGKIKQLPPDEADIQVGGNMNNLGHGLDNIDNKSVGNMGGNRYKLEGGGRGGVMSGGPTPGTPACVKQESDMDTDRQETLNMTGPQHTQQLKLSSEQLELDQLPAGARHHTTHSSSSSFRHPASRHGTQSENRRRSDKTDLETSPFSLSRGPLSENQNKPKKDSGGTMKPNVSITPIATNNQYDDPLNRITPTTGIEIIPLGQGKMSSAGSSSSLKAKSRDLKRSYSEDDKRKFPKKEKKKRDDKIRQSLNQDTGKSSKSDSSKTSWTAEIDKNKSNLAGVIERLSQKNKDNLSIEIKPASSMSSEKLSTAPNMEITLNQVKKDEFSPKPKLKLTIKPPTKHFDKTETDGGSSSSLIFNKMSSASPKLESNTFQIPKLNKFDSSSPTSKNRPSFNKSPSTSPKHFLKSPHSKINERFITDPSSVTKRAEVRFNFIILILTK